MSDPNSSPSSGSPSDRDSQIARLLSASTLTAADPHADAATAARYATAASAGQGGESIRPSFDYHYAGGVLHDNQMMGVTLEFERTQQNIPWRGGGYDSNLPAYQGSESGGESTDDESGSSNSSSQSTHSDMPGLWA